MTDSWHLGLGIHFDWNRGMELRFAMVADHVTETKDGKLVVVGEFDRISATASPIQHGPVYLVARFEARVSEGAKHRLRVGLFDADGRAVMPMSPDLEMTFIPLGPGYPLRGQIIVHFNVLHFKDFGDYEFHILLDGHMLGTVPVRVVKGDRRPKHGQA